MNDEFPRRQADDADPDRQPDYGFGGAPLFRDEVPPAGGPAFGAGPGAVGNPGATGFHDASAFRDPAPGYGGAAPWGDQDGGRGGSGLPAGAGGASGDGRGDVRGLDYGAGGDYGTGLMSGFDGGADTLSSSGGFPAQRFAGPRNMAETSGAGAGPGYGGARPGAAPVPRPAPGAPSPDAFSHPAPNAFSGGAAAAGGEPEFGPSEGPLRVVPADQASALLRIKLPENPPVPSTTLRGDAPIEDVVEASQMLHRVSPAKPNALPGDVLALTTATMVVPMPGAAFGGVRAVQRPARLTASVPPDLASRAEADLLSDTVEQFFGDFDAIGRELQAQRASGAAAAGAAAGAGAGVGVSAVPGAAAVPTVPAQGGENAGAEPSQPATLPGQYAPTGAPLAGRYGVPTQVPGYDAARRSPVGMRYLGGIFHDSSGESSFYDPSTESLVPMGAAAISASDFRRTVPAITRPVPPPRTGPRTAQPPRESTDFKAGSARSAGAAGTTGAVRSTGAAAAAAASAGAAPVGAGPRTPTVPAPTRGGGRTSGRTGFPAGGNGSDSSDDTKVLPTGHWSDHHPDHHRSRRTSRRGRVALVSALSVTLAFGTLYGAALAFEGQVPKGTLVDGVAIGGMTKTAAVAKLSAALSPTLSAPLRLTADGAAFQLSPEQAGLHIDYAGTVAAAAASRTDPTVAIPALAGTGRDVRLQVSVDRTALKAALTSLTAGFDKPMVDGSVIFPGGVPTPIAPRPGREIDVDAAAGAVVSAFDDGVAAVRVAAMSPAGTLPTAPAAYAIAPAKTALSPAHHTSSAHTKQPSATPSTPSATPSATDSPSGKAGMPSAPASTAPSAPVPSGTAPAVAPVPAPALVPAPGGVPATASTAGGSFPAAPIALTVQNVQPTVTPAAVAQAMQDFARPAMSAPVALVTGSVRTVLKPAILGRHLAIEPDGHGGLAPKLDGAGIRAELDHDALAKLEQPPTDASFTVSGGKPVLVPGKNGVGYSPEAIQNAVLPVLAKTSSTQRVVTVPIGPLPPALTTEAAQALGIDDVMGLYTAPFSATAQRTANVKHAADLVRGQIVQPGQVFSLNQVLGARSTANGFIPASASGQSGSSSTSSSSSSSSSSASASAQDAGAGTSLVATALFNAEYLAGLKDMEHHPHATVTDHYPPGLEAAVVYPEVDLKFQNDSGAPVYLWTSATDNAVTVAVLGQKAWDSVRSETSPHYALVQPKTTYSMAGSCVANDGVPGFQVDVTRTLTKAGQDPVREVFHSSYAAQDKVVCGQTGPGSGPSAAGGAAGAPTGSPTGGAAASQYPPTATQGATTSGPNAPSGTGTPGGGASSGTPDGTPTSGSDGSLLGGLLGGPPSRH
ncbi:VanW family protein [Catenulispora acidiphila DSM 44928]|uniref:VanW family protein n=1 Tax=Catenulispora acidiphila (strain DSM 44928 / JCM 14897 / NBRC 102108 / NRRL B-24433 / ID139908) TaxID=479433 RepID=C7Q0R5_CATAD|nr:VanW domain-containing protein [Catenulispora acidiphila]ACU69693.1 VanW family protein [Catenulispora acidiphila DSM 44928]